MAFKKAVNYKNRVHIERMVRLYSQTKRTNPVTSRLAEVAELLVEVRCPHETDGAKVRYRKAVRQWLEDEGDATPQRLAYWYQVILDGGQEPALDAMFEVLRAIDQAAVQSILQSLNKELVGGGRDALQFLA